VSPRIESVILTIMDEELWETHADWWQDGFTNGTDAEYEQQILPMAADLLADSDRVLDVGTGEGQLARLFVAAGASLAVGVDPAHNQIAEGVARGGGVHYGRAQASSLPFVDATFDAAVACLVFEHIDELDVSLAEVARVLEPDGRFVLFLNHPLLQTPGSGWIDDHTMEPAEQYWRIGPYLVESAQVEEVYKGVFIPFVHRPLSRYVNALVDAGLVIERMIEPAPPEGFLERAPAYRDASAIPRLLVLVCRRK